MHNIIEALEAKREAARLGGGRGLLQAGARVYISSRKAGACAEAAKELAEYGPRFHRGQLVLVAQQHQPRVGRQGLQQGIHHFQMHHRGFVHDEHIHIQRVARVVPELARVGPRAEQRMQSAGWANALNQRIQVQPPGDRKGKRPSISRTRAKANQKTSLLKRYFLEEAGPVGPALPRNTLKNSEDDGSTTMTSLFLLKLAL